MPRRNDGQVAATMRAGGAPETAALDVAMSELELTVFIEYTDLELEVGTAD